MCRWHLGESARGECVPLSFPEGDCESNEVPGIEREKQPVPGGTIDHLATVGWYWKPKCDQFYRP